MKSGRQSVAIRVVNLGKLATDHRFELTLRGARCCSLHRHLADGARAITLHSQSQFRLLDALAEHVRAEDSHESNAGEDQMK